MEVSKMGLKILKRLKERSDGYVIRSNNSTNSAMCQYEEIKEWFPKHAYTKLTFELLSLMDQKLICTNMKNPFEFPSPEKIGSSTIKYGISGKGHAALEQRTFTLLSKYVPLSISIISLLLSIVTLPLKLFEK